MPSSSSALLLQASAKLLLLWWQWPEAVMAEVAEKEQSCLRWDQPKGIDDRGLSQNGDVVIGGLFVVHNQPPTPDLSFTRHPGQEPCFSLQKEPYRWAHALVFAVEEINRNPYLLPGVRLGYQILDSCTRYPWSVRAAMSLISGGNHSCKSTGPVRVIIGDASSTQTIMLSRILSPLQVPLISYQASCACLSNRREFPNVFRTIPSDVYQARTMAHLAEHYGWTWVGAVVVNNDYGLLAVQAFRERAQGTGTCLAFFETLNRETLAQDVDRAATTVQMSSARVVLVFAWYTDVEALLLELARRNVTGRQFLASEAWSTSSYLLNNPALRTIGNGVLGVAIRSAPIPGLEAHLRKLHPSQHPGDALLRDLWREEFGCDPDSESGPDSLPPCSGTESLEGVQSTFTDTTYLRVTYNVYLAVYAAAHAFHSLLLCSPIHTEMNTSQQCSNDYNISAAEILQHLSQVNFTTQLGENFVFHGGDIPAVYDLVNWQEAPNGVLKYITVGRVEGSKLHLEDSAIWWTTGSQVPVSVCSESCPSGTRKASRKGEPICCFDCLPCADGEISNTTDSLTCDRCPLEFWSNDQKNMCVPLTVEFLSFTDAMGITLTTVAVSGAVMTAAVAVVFLYNRHTPIVKANNSELSFMLLMSLKLCFLCSLLFMGQPTDWSCHIQQAAFGISFVLCISCILVKTIVVLAVFRSARPGSDSVMKWFGPGQQRGSVFLFTCVQVVICAAWLSLKPPQPHRNIGLKIILECTVGSVAGFATLLGYISLLAAICFLLAFFARKLPDNFNEAKFITFSMLIFCAVWIAFVPAYVSSPGKYAIAVEIFAILASSFGLLLCIFVPKCFIILLRPEKNTKTFLMGKTQTQQ
ncbi:extracellular calcium-sensing receptor-like [Alosa pseudoharengus]|uniref:extracellular calcium-sensing receptor-like n=1 Tax=Alosa pseudoharengus TaxID=34774 RepID=UPI003F8C7161